MKRKPLQLVLAAVLGLLAGAPSAQELVLGYLTAETGPFVSLSRSTSSTPPAA